MNYRILSAEYETSVAQPDGLKPSTLPEAAFAGRSNVGKSTLINSLTGRTSLARTSKTPGRTRMLNYFSVRWARQGEDEAEEQFESSFVDIPGYGYAQVSKKERDSWKRLVEAYLFGSRELEALVVLIDARRGPGEEELMQLGADIPAAKLPVLTKVDKLNQKERSRALKQAAAELGLHPDDIFVTGVAGGKSIGVEKLRGALGELLFPRGEGA